MEKVNESMALPSKLFEIGKLVKMALNILEDYSESADRDDLTMKVDDSLNDAIYNLGQLAAYEFQITVYESNNIEK